MGLYRKQDLVSIIYSFQFIYKEEFITGNGNKSKVTDVFYIKEGEIEVDGTSEDGYSIIYYFENGTSLTPKQFCTLNCILPAYPTFSSMAMRGS